MSERDALDRDLQFVAGATGFEWKNALGCANAALLVYSDEEAILSQARDVWKMEDARFFSDESTQAFAMTNDEIVVVAFRGTQADQADDLLIDAEIKLVAGLLAGRIHYGFHTAMTEAWLDVERAIDEFGGGSGGKPLFFTGHSLGAALAALATSTLLSQPRPVQGLYTFGQPRTGDEDWAEEFNRDFKSRTFRFVNNNDVVTRVPPSALGYSHVGTFLYFDEDGDFHEDVGLWYRFRDRIKGRLDDLFEEGLDGVKDHAMEGYLENVRRAAITSRTRPRPRRYPQFEHARQVRRTTLQLVADLTQEQSELRPGKGKWSVGEVLDHMLRLDDAIVHELQVTLNQRRIGLPFVYRGIADFDTGIPFFLRPMLPFFEIPFGFLNVFFPQATRQALYRSRNTPLRSPGFAVPSYRRPIGTLRKRLGETYERLAEQQDENPGIDLNRVYYYNPVAGLASVAGMYDFVSNHEKRHQDQLRDILAHASFP